MRRIVTIGKVRVGNCTAAENTLTVEAGTTFGVDRYTGKVRYLAHGNYPPTHFVVTTDGGPSEGGAGVVFCVQAATRALRYYPTMPTGCPASTAYVPVVM